MYMCILIRPYVKQNQIPYNPRTRITNQPKPRTEHGNTLYSAHLSNLKYPPAQTNKTETHLQNINEYK